MELLNYYYIINLLYNTIYIYLYTITTTTTTMKTTTSLTVDIELMLIAREKKLNLSSLFNDFLKNYFKIKETEKDSSDINSSIATMKSKLLDLEKKREKLLKGNIKKTVRLCGGR